MLALEGREDPVDTLLKECCNNLLVDNGSVMASSAECCCVTEVGEVEVRSQAETKSFLTASAAALRMASGSFTLVGSGIAGGAPTEERSLPLLLSFPEEDDFLSLPEKDDFFSLPEEDDFFSLLPPGIVAAGSACCWATDGFGLVCPIATAWSSKSSGLSTVVEDGASVACVFDVDMEKMDKAEEREGVKLFLLPLRLNFDDEDDDKDGDCFFLDLMRAIRLFSESFLGCV